MVIVNIGKDRTSLTHESTSYRIGRSFTTTIGDNNREVITVTDIVDEASNLTGIGKEIWYSDVIVPYDTVLYAQAKRHYAETTTSIWSNKVHEVWPDRDAGDDVFKHDIILDAPTATINVDEFLDQNSTTVTLGCGSLRTKLDGHLYTTWILTNGNGKVLFRSVKDTINKRSITIDKSMLDLDGVAILKLLVIHGTTIGYTSPPGVKSVELVKYKFELTSNIKSVTPYSDLVVNFKLLNAAHEDYPLTDVVIKNTDGEVVYSKDFTVGESQFILPRDKMKEKSTYIVEVNDIHNALPMVFKITTISSREINPIDPLFIYEEDYIDTGLTLSGVVKKVNNEQLLDNIIPINTGDSGKLTPYNYNTRKGTMNVSGVPFSFLAKNSTGRDGFSMLVLDERRVLVDTKTAEHEECEFEVFDYDRQLSLNYIKRSDEKWGGPSNKTYITYVPTSDDVYYFARLESDDLVFRRWNTVTGVTETLPLRPDLASERATLVYLGGHRILSFGASGESNLAYVYDIASKLWRDITLVPTNFRELYMSAFLRRDGKVICFNDGIGSNDILLFDPSNNSFDTRVTTLDDDIQLNSTIKLRDGTFMRYSTLENEKKLYIYK